MLCRRRVPRFPAHRNRCTQPYARLGRMETQTIRDQVVDATSIARKLLISNGSSPWSREPDTRSRAAHALLGRSFSKWISPLTALSPHITSPNAPLPEYDCGSPEFRGKHATRHRARIISPRLSPQRLSEFEDRSGRQSNLKTRPIERRGSGALQGQAADFCSQQRTFRCPR